MERIEMIERAAVALVAQCHVASVFGAERIERIRDALGLYIQSCPASGVMLGGAYSRLQLFAWDQPQVGGLIWLADDLDVERRLFAIAHELGHYVLHRGEGVNLHTACDQRAIDPQADPAELRAEDHVVQEYSPRVRRELEASSFAAELLAPRAEVRRLFTAVPQMDAERMAHHFGVSATLAARRLIDALLAPGRPANYADMEPQPSDDNIGTAPTPGALLARLDESQREAACAEGPTLVMAGPGTGKTATLVGRVAYLVGERHIQPEQALALTFSNRAAGEMRERLERSGLPGERMPVMTIHAFAAMLLRDYPSRVPHALDEVELRSDFRILDEANAYLLMEGLLGELPLRYYRSLGNPTAHVNTLRSDFSQARDELLTPGDYHALVNAMRLAPDDDVTDEQGGAKNGRGKKTSLPDGLFTREQKARAGERARAYAVWDRALRRRGLVDFGGLVQRAVELLMADPKALANVRARYPQMLVDEFQDTNHAAAELLMLVAGERGEGLWVVGDQNQSIYRFRGASPDNLRRLTERYPHLRVMTLRRCYRAVPAIVRLGSAMAARMSHLTPGAVTADEPAGALAEVMRPVDLEAVRPDSPDDHDDARPAIRRAEDFASAAHERLGLAAAIERFHTLGYRYGDQAILCRNHKQERQIAATLAGQSIPVSQLGDFFDRPEIKDALMLLYLAMGPDARGVLRAAPLLACLGHPPPADGELAATTRMLSTQRHPLPSALCNQR
ncbi:MAG TPA: UvrD-helicase domain-containing protein, partial [Ktedonobacterales bacterium]|nr:UvrD-helicase domain-containing protein [Ktedonobacterales bacterium]